MTATGTVSDRSVLRDIAHLLKHQLLIALVMLMLIHRWGRYELSLVGRILWTCASHLLNSCLLGLDLRLLMLGRRLISKIALRSFIVLQNRGRWNGRVFYSTGLFNCLNDLLGTHMGRSLDSKQMTWRTAFLSRIDDLSFVWLGSNWFGALSWCFVKKLSTISFIFLYFLYIIRILENERRC